ncbi:dual specificity protein kinase splA isoform X2 [Microplitis demolitor]|uniref:dual specificity protein kinase splA isoform X2 n=1 Tax=Microplitis demolitor TaxID=69319 RepID=UPI00235B6D6A|nr:dual specificity protein kinase splA isoform X2 [Microplitis demolitor]
MYFFLLLISVFCLTPDEIEAQRSGWNVNPNTQYHIQTDEGPERYFRFQTLNGQFRKEKRLEDGTVVGTEGWLDPLGYLRIKDYIADREGFRILKSKTVYVGINRPIEDAVAASKRVPPTSGILVKPRRPPNPFRQPVLQDFSSNSIESNTIKPYRAYSPSENSRRFIVPSTTSYPRSNYYSTTITPIAIANELPKPITTNYIRPYRVYNRSYRRSHPYIGSPTVEIQPPEDPNNNLNDDNNNNNNNNNNNDNDEVVKVTPKSTYGLYRLDNRRYRAALASGRFNTTSRQIRTRRPNYTTEKSDSQTKETKSPVYYSLPSNPRARQPRLSQGISSAPAEYEFPQYDGTHTTADGFQYYLKTHYHEEEQQPDKSIGSFGYVDPFGIRRVVYYKADGQNGFVHKKNNRYVGFDATPYDPVPPKAN